uniref:CBL-interacting protein kinase 33-like n=1 Tax=Phallusia mammillata TaxID=59560 RepID=A0A6F9DG34_9ASCI|nr:CBL-interacting protein kinase 33-like [Phallusia mammillata]
MLEWFDAASLRTSCDEKGVLEKAHPFGTTRRCWHKKLGEVAVICKKPPKNDDPYFVERVNRAFHQLKNINHKNILSIHGFILWTNGFGIIVDATNGACFHNLLQKSALMWDLKLQLAHDLASAIRYLHHFDDNYAIVHGSICAENLVLTDDLKVQLLYFNGLEKMSNESILSETNTHSKENDVFDFGIFLYELISQEPVKTPMDPTLCRKKLKEIKETIKTLNQTKDLNVLKFLERVMWRCLEAKTGICQVSEWLTQELKKRGSKTILSNKIDLIKNFQSHKMVLDKKNVTPLNTFSDPFVLPDTVPMFTIQPPETVHLRKTHETIVFLGGLMGSTTRNVVEYDPFTDTLHRLPDLYTGRWSCMCFFLCNSIFVFGGIVNGKPLKSVEYLNIADNMQTWGKKGDMLQAIQGSTAVVIKGLGYLPGGITDSMDEDSDLSTVIQCYNPQNDEWQIVGNLLTPRGHHAAAGYQNRLYTMGGVTYKDIRLRELEYFDVTTKQSSFLQPMYVERGLLGSVCLNGFIYALGGQQKMFVTLDTVECYNPATNEWTEEKERMNKPSKAFGACVAGGKIFAIGGVGQNNAGKAIEVFDPVGIKWKLLSKKLDKDWISPATTTITRSSDFPSLF